MNNSKLAALLGIDRTLLPPDGGEQYNRLIFARSPYLLQHAENPVEWREWGDEAFDEAKKRDLPIFVSIGYSTCHWCHVMAAESFSDSEVAAVLNGSFIAIKVDREERPDIDEFYMAASQALTGGGGWPLNVFLAHDRTPFFTITYLPKYPRHNAPGFINLLNNISTLWREKRESLSGNADGICRAISATSAHTAPTGIDQESLSSKAVHHLEKIFDRSYGGFGSAVKFPMPTYLLFLLSREKSNYPDAGNMAVMTLESMMHGGINDQIGGGFHRYAVDQKWVIPHFEKMLYDQALLITAYANAFAKTGEQRFLDTAIKTAGFAVNELLTPEGGFAAGLDADSEGEEGLFYTWDYEELESVLGVDCKLALEFWGATPGGDLDGRCILHSTVGLEGFSAAKGTTAANLMEIIANASTRLLAARGSRERPLRDLKVICSWNSLMITALVRLYAVSGEISWLKIAENTARFILSNMVNTEGRLLRNWLGTSSSIPAFAEDYAFFSLGLADLAHNSPDPVWREKLEYFVNELVRLFLNESGEVSFCGIDAEKMPIDIPAVQDGVLPSTAGSCAALLIRSARVLDNESFAAVGRRIIERYRGITEKNPSACLSLIMAEEELASRI